MSTFQRFEEIISRQQARELNKLVGRSIAKSSCIDLRSQLYRASDRSYILQKECFIYRCYKISTLIQLLINYLESSVMMVNKYKVRDEQPSQTFQTS